MVGPPVVSGPSPKTYFLIQLIHFSLVVLAYGAIRKCAANFVGGPRWASFSKHNKPHQWTMTTNHTRPSIVRARKKSISPMFVNACVRVAWMFQLYSSHTWANGTLAHKFLAWPWPLSCDQARVYVCMCTYTPNLIVRAVHNAHNIQCTCRVRCCCCCCCTKRAGLLLLLQHAAALRL